MLKNTASWIYWNGGFYNWKCLG